MTENNKGLDHRLVEGALPEGTVAALIYSTFPSRAAAVEAGRALVARQLVGCINILSGMTAIYSWQGAIEEADEVVLLAKVTADGVRAAADALLEMHHYETPALLVIPVPMVGVAYLDWLKDGLGRAPLTS